MHDVELIYHQGCPNVDAARRVLRRALREAGAHSVWREWDRDAPSSPERVRGYGSPTILVDGRDVAGVPASSDAASCRLYVDGTGRRSGVPPYEDVLRAIKTTGSARSG